MSKVFTRIITIICWILIASYFSSSNRQNVNRIKQEIKKTAETVQTEIRTAGQALAPSPTSSVLMKTDLSPGATSAAVRLLQAVLSTKNYMPAEMATGFYGQLTYQAVLDYQRASGLTQNGIFDEETRMQFNSDFGGKQAAYYLSLIPTPAPVQPASSNTTGSGTGPWGVAERVTGTQHAWSMKVGEDAAMATAKEIFDALNAYRSKKGVNGLNWDGALAGYSQDRASFFVSNGGLDDHKGFDDYLQNQDNVMKLDFYHLGENSSCGYRMTGTHLIEWIFAGDAPHDNNQLSSQWSDVGIGVSGTCVDLVFGGQRIR